MKKDFAYLNLREKVHSDYISNLFPGWESGKEKLIVFSPHDDDALIGAGYAMEVALEEGAEVYVLIFCNGDCGYSMLNHKESIIDIRSRETHAAYEFLGIRRENIIKFNFPDFSTFQYIGYKMRDGSTGVFIKIVELIRELGITRVMIPNGHREHLDHEAVYKMGAYDVIQAGDPIIVDHGGMQKIKNILQYSVWADFSPEDALINNAGSIRASRAVLAPKYVEEKVADALRRFESQGQIIEDLIASRKERLMDDRYIELYIEFDPRPKLNFKPYTELVRNIMKL